MSDVNKSLRIGFIPLVDAAALFVAVDKGFAAAEGLDVELVREVSWSNIRDKLAIGHFDAAHLLAPMAIASSLGFGHVKVPLVAPLNLAMNGNAITVSSALYTQLRSATDGDIADPAVSARALATVARAREAQGLEPLTFGMTFPYSTHNYQLRYWMAAGGLDPDQDLRLVVLPPPYMVDSIAQGQVDGFCVGAPWNSVAVDAGVGRILHLGCEIFARAPEKVLALRESDVEAAPSIAAALTRAHEKAARYIAVPDNREEIAAILARRDRVGVAAKTILRSLEGHLKMNAQGAIRSDENYLIIGAARPDPRQAAWLYAQMLRWGQGTYSQELFRAAKHVFRVDLFDMALGDRSPPTPGAADASDPIGAFDRTAFGDDLRTYLAAFPIGCRL